MGTEHKGPIHYYNIISAKYKIAIPSIYYYILYYKDEPISYM